ncbi:dihydrolipoyllysine-residue succinyltransferase component of 2-oxoglutarate dehydrogenase complex, mitochondrial-like [Macrobrachium rosenbergii]|uniref:dihydrolipoyllysine-residue succinyltransferase component of 2-oxoglutarate dehydrogenase complex, mitochondrial-like n=1 Tax=Macrobrachium rosenbergii TaxID=79674 RepID=UPI0034D67607
MIGLRHFHRYWTRLPSQADLQVLRLSTKCLSTSASRKLLQAETLPLGLLSKRHYEQHLGSFKNFHTSVVFGGEVKPIEVPPFAESITEGDLRWVKEVGESFEEDEVIAEVETDKVTMPIKAPAAGVLKEINVEDGSVVKAGVHIGKIELGAGGAAPAKKEAPAAEAAAAPPPTAAAPPPPPPPPPPPTSAAAGPIPTTPPPSPPPPTTPKASIPVAAIKHASFIQQAEVKVPPADYSKEITGTRTEQRVKITRMRARIAQRLKDAQNTNAMLTTFNEIDMGNIMEMRKSIGDQFLKRHGIKLGFMSAFVKASAYALTEQPTVNAVMEGSEIIYRDYVDISVAVATPKGLVVPVLRNVEGMNYLDIEKGIMALGEKARTGALAVEDMDGGTFTISNGGVFGSLFGTPIINPPQSAILGMHGIFDRPVAKNGQVVIKPMMYVALTYDHRLIDGREAVTFLRKIKQAVEDPRIMLCGL